MGIDNAVSFIILLLSFFNFLNLKMVNYMWVEIDIDKTYFFCFFKIFIFYPIFLCYLKHKKYISKLIAKSHECDGGTNIRIVLKIIFVKRLSWKKIKIKRTSDLIISKAQVPEAKACLELRFPNHNNIECIWYCSSFCGCGMKK
jgi:hypothetical protein